MVGRLEKSVFHSSFVGNDIKSAFFCGEFTKALVGTSNDEWILGINHERRSSREKRPIEVIKLTTGCSV